MLIFLSSYGFIHSFYHPEFTKFKNLPNLEIELRLGKFHGNKFDTNVGELNFNKILDSLKQFDGWGQVVDTNSTSYFLGDKRMDINEDTDSMVTFIKKRIYKFDFVIPNSSLDVRFSAAQEIPITDMDCDDVMDFMRVKQRISFIRKNLSIDMTIVTAQPDDPDDESDTFYEIELEIVDPLLVDSDKTFYNIIYKIQCILNTL